MPNLTRLSKFVSLTLRHRANDFGLHLDSQGFVDFEDLKRIVVEKSTDVYSEEDWRKVLNGELDGKKRFELKDGRIRALYGHSKVEPVIYEPVAPPEVLYHGTTLQAERGIRREGLRSMKRQYVHLSGNTERALNVGSRRTEDVRLLVVRAAEAYRAGIEFYSPEPEHYLAQNIPPQFIDFPKE
ncbi:MAG TPA: RNA 2'-phosphotransferase [Anaerolineales bacterium]|nr:RNA 2'-phosphotransferase [Anaerolineales bacterium]HNN12017.1 RNA 2'-phosphotransferase [Anaerolineales bacterium]